MDLSAPDDDLRKPLQDIVPANKFERALIAGDPVFVNVDQVTLSHALIHLLRAAAHADVSSVQPPTRNYWGFSTAKIAAHHRRMLGDAFTPEFDLFAWRSTLNDLKAACALLDPGTTTIDIAPRIRGSLEVVLTAATTQPARDKALKNFQLAMRTLAPVFSGEVTRADLSA